MTRKRVQPIRWIKDFVAPLALKRQLAELERHVYDAVSNVANAALDYTGLDGVDVVGAIVRSSRDIFASTPSSTVSNLSGVSEKDIVTFAPTVHVDATGIAAPASNDTHRKLLVNTSTSYTVTLKHNATSLTAARYWCPHQVDYELRPGESVVVDYTAGKWRVIGQSQPFRIVRTASDLPTVSGGVYTLPASSGIWFFPVDVNGGTNKLDVLQGAIVWSVGDGGYTSTHATNPAVRVRNTHNHLPFRATNATSGVGIECFTLSTHFFTNWDTAQNVLCNSLRVFWLGGSFNFFLVPTSVDDVRVRSFTGSVRVTNANGSGTVGWVEARDGQQGGTAGPMFEVEANMRLRYRFTIDDCLAYNGQLFKGGSSLNAGGDTPLITISHSRSITANSIECGVVPAGGLTIDDCTLNASTPFSGFTALTTSPGRVIARRNMSSTGTLLQETPNGHILVNGSNVAVTQRPRMAIKSGSTYVTPADNSADNRSEWDLASIIPPAYTEPLGSLRTVRASDGSSNFWTTDPEVDSLTAHEYLALRLDSDPGDPPDGVRLFYDNTDRMLRARFDESYVADLMPDRPVVSGQQAKRFCEQYVFSRTGGTAQYTFLSEAYTSPFGLTHGTSNMVVVEGEIDARAIAGGTEGGGRKIPFTARWLNSGAADYAYNTADYNTGDACSLWDGAVTVGLGGAGGPLEFRVTPGAENVEYDITITGNVFVAPIP